MNVLNENEMQLSTDINRMFEVRKHILELTNEINEKAEEIKKLSREYSLYDIDPISTHRHPYDINVYVKAEFDKKAWTHLLEESGLAIYMDTKARKEFDNVIYGKASEIPEFTKPNVASTFGDLIENRGEIFERSIINVFKSLSWDYKTNTPCKFGKRIITRLCELRWSGGLQIHYHHKDKINDLEKAFCVLDKKKVPEYRHSISEKADEFMKDHYGEIYESEYMDLKFYKNGNSHITFKRPELVNQMNMIIAKHFPQALPAR